MSTIRPLDDPTLPHGIRARVVPAINGLDMHILEAGAGAGERPMLLLLHGFPELAYSWRKVMGPLADAGYHVVAPDQRGYGRTIGWDNRYDGDLASFRPFNLVRDVVGLVSALGKRRVASIIGHDFGATVAAFGALLRPDLFRSMVLMSAPFGGPPVVPFGSASTFPPPADSVRRDDIHSALAALARPRKHYQAYYTTREANENMMAAAGGVHAFLRAYFHYKSADWTGNDPHPLDTWSAAELARMPTYYIMDRDAGMAETVAPYLPSAEAIAACRWMSEPEMAVFAAEYGRTTFQGGLNWYRARVAPAHRPEMEVLSGKAIDVPSLFIAGRQDWGIYQVPGAIDTMQRTATTRMEAVRLVEGAGHWVQQERPEEVVSLLLPFLSRWT